MLTRNTWQYLPVWFSKYRKLRRIWNNIPMFYIKSKCLFFFIIFCLLWLHFIEKWSLWEKKINGKYFKTRCPGKSFDIGDYVEQRVLNRGDFAIYTAHLLGLFWGEFNKGFRNEQNLQVGDEGNNYTQNSDEAIAWNSEKGFEGIMYIVGNKTTSDIWAMADFTVSSVDLTTSRSRKKVPWMDPIHISIELLRFPLQRTSLYCHPVI